MEQNSLHFDVPVINKTNLNQVLDTLMKKDSRLEKETQNRFKTLFKDFIKHIRNVTEDLLKSAEVVVLDSHQTTVIVLSGGGQNKFHVSINQKGEVEILSVAPPPVTANPNSRTEPVPERLKETIDNDDARTENSLHFDVPVINKTNLNQVLDTLMKKDSRLEKETQNRFKTLFKDFIKHIRNVKEDLLKSAEVVVLDSHQTTVIVLSGGGQNKFHVSINQKGEVEILSVAPPPVTANPNSRTEPVPERLKETIDNDDARTEYIAESITLPVINKTKLGKVQVKICGNEGSKNTPVQSIFRKLLQSTIDYLEKEKDTVWTNAEITHYDSYGNTVVVTAGKAQHKFTVQVNGKDEIQITATRRPGILSPIKGFFKEEYKQSIPKRAISGSEGTPTNGQWTISHTK